MVAVPTSDEHLPESFSTNSALSIRYLLALNVPLYRGAQGHYFADDLWFKDLCRHVAYIPNLTLACPVVSSPAPANAVLINGDPRLSAVRIIDLPATNSILKGVLLLPSMVLKMWEAVAQADLVHTGIAGWPVPLAWLAIPLARAFRKPSVVIVESAPWRLQPGLSRNLKSRCIAYVWERLGRWCTNNADLSIFTQEEYRNSLLRRKSAGHIIHASWIDDEAILEENVAGTIWEQKLHRNELKLVFVGQLKASKGVTVLLEAAKLAANHEVAVSIDIFGSGELAEYCNAAAAQISTPVRIRCLGTVAYGEPLFQQLRQYHALVVPSLADEQPRIVYDAYSQALPVLAANTPGLRDCVKNGTTGWLFQPNDVVALATVFQKAAQNFAELRRLGLEALSAARAMTHKKMHAERHLLLSEFLAKRTRPASFRAVGSRNIGS